jgi:hypothetical protein
VVDVTPDELVAFRQRFFPSGDPVITLTPTQIAQKLAPANGVQWSRTTATWIKNLFAEWVEKIHVGFPELTHPELMKKDPRCVKGDSVLSYCPHCKSNHDVVTSAGFSKSLALSNGLTSLEAEMHKLYKCQNQECPPNARKRLANDQLPASAKTKKTGTYQFSTGFQANDPEFHDKPWRFRHDFPVSNTAAALPSPGLDGLRALVDAVSIDPHAGVDSDVDSDVEDAMPANKMEKKAKVGKTDVTGEDKDDGGGRDEGGKDRLVGGNASSSDYGIDHGQGPRQPHPACRQRLLR